MDLIILTIALNVLIGILFKVFERFDLSNLQVIFFNYIICVITASLTLGDYSYLKNIYTESWYPYALIMGIFFFSVFLLIGKSMQQNGVMVTSTAQRLSLLMPVIVGILFFGEGFGLIKLIGIILTIIAVLLITYEKSDKGLNYLIFIIWLGSGIVDLSLYLVEKLDIVKDAGLKFTSSLFMSAGYGAGLTLIYLVMRNKEKFSWKNIVGGITLGIPNFFSIYLVLVILKRGWSGSIVFPLINSSVVLLSTIVGYFFFSEKLNKNKILGLTFALLAIIILSWKK